ncbi:MAG: IclR family transcriptional regulator [Coprobacillus cateniformis]|uniref:IclR family transcriptional regulator n=1 Tax=Longibaculum muris TaxID=1796628 RepID=UPI003AB47AF0|nr:IclR family transcriptional regulator [Coprobacillus cateniformis]
MKLNRTLMRAIDILELLSKSKEGYTLTQLSTVLDSPKSSIFDIMKTLVFKNMVLEDNQSGVTRYKIGLQSFLIGSSYINAIDLVNIARNDLIDFANKMQATTFMAILDDNMVTYIYKYESERSIITTANIGTRRSIHCAALGKAMIAFASKEEIEEAIAKTDFISYTQHTITSPDEYLKELEEVKQKGYAKDDRENTLQQIAAAAPIFDHTGQVVASISCVGFYESQVNLDDLGILVKAVADRISAKLGHC